MTKNVLAFSKRIDFKTILEIECKEAIGFAPIVMDSLDEFSAILGLLHDIEILVIDLVAEPLHLKLLRSLEGNASNTKNVFLITNGDPVDSKYPQFTTDNIKEFIHQFKTILNPKGVVEQSYISIPIASFVHFKILPFDLWIKLSDQKYVKCIHGTEDIDEAQLISLEAKGVKELYFEKKYNKEFSTLLINNMINKVESEYDDLDEKFKATDQVFSTTKDIVQKLGLPSRVVQVCASVMESITNDVMQSKDRFSEFLMAMKGKEGLSYQFRLVELTSLVATELVENLPDGNKPEMIRTVVFCSFFCDIALKDVGHLRIREGKDLAHMWPIEKRDLEEHALRASELVANYAMAPIDAARVIRQHHGVNSGKGFAKPHDNLLTLSLCLMASHEIALAILDNSRDLPVEVLRKLIESNKGSYLLPWFQSFEQSCKKHLKTA